MTQLSLKCLTEVQDQVIGYVHKVTRYIPIEYREEIWVYAAVYVAVYTLFLLFKKSTFGFICTISYTMLISMLTLKYYKLGPLHQINVRSSRPAPRLTLQKSLSQPLPQHSDGQVVGTYLPEECQGLTSNPTYNTPQTPVTPSAPQHTHPSSESSDGQVVGTSSPDECQGPTPNPTANTPETPITPSTPQHTHLSSASSDRQVVGTSSPDECQGSRPTPRRTPQKPQSHPSVKRRESGSVQQ